MAHIRSLTLCSTFIRWPEVSDITASCSPKTRFINTCHCLFFLFCFVLAELFEDVDGVETVTNPLDNVTAGLQDGSGQQLPLEAVHVKCKLMDLLSQVRRRWH